MRKQKEEIKPAHIYWYDYVPWLMYHKSQLVDGVPPIPPGFVLRIDAEPIHTGGGYFQLSVIETDDHRYERGEFAPHRNEGPGVRSWLATGDNGKSGK